MIPLFFFNWLSMVLLLTGLIFFPTWTISLAVLLAVFLLTSLALFSQLD